ncbi:MAG: Stp1/IreP family PP2C-type Ser/Thr phosphatase [Clostridiales bacterium]|jgi:serine/threonine protein phosphatase PrpC|nr:Stp1/IreP family PP2C-type Ser/Thr phosphatase [Clostridiales bacterium]
MILEYGGCSHRGMVRKSNEDYYYISDNQNEQHLAIVADGMGGHNAGELASRMAVETILEIFSINKDQYTNDPTSLIKESIRQANYKIYSHAQQNENCKGMGTTLVLAFFDKGKVYFGHVGDSRGYLIRKGEIIQITKDHSLVQELLDNGTITLEEVENHPQKNIITRALGTERSIEIDCHNISLEEDDIVLLCTDGLVLHVDLQENIELFESSSSMQELTADLVQQALERGGLDNITVVAIKYYGMVKEG